MNEQKEMSESIREITRAAQSQADAIMARAKALAEKEQTEESGKKNEG